MKSVNAVTIKELYDLSHTEAKPLMEQYTYPWEVLPHIGEFIVKLGESLPKEEYTEVAEHVWVHKTAKVFASAYLAGPAIIGAETEVRQCAFVRGNALVGKGCVIDKSIIAENTKIGEGAILGIGRRTTRTVTEIKKINRILADVQVVHLPFVYIQYFL